MALIVIYDEGNGDIKDVLPSANTPEYDQRTDVLVNPDISLLDTVDRKYVKVSGGVLVEMTAQEKADKDQAIQDAINAVKTTEVNNLEISLKEAFVSWLNVYNSKVPAQYQITAQELKNQVLSDLGL